MGYQYCLWDSNHTDFLKWTPFLHMHRDTSGKKMVGAASNFQTGTTTPYCGVEHVQKKRNFDSTMGSEPNDLGSSRVKKGCLEGSVGHHGTGRSGQRTKVQRENHILAERQRREEMNDKFCVLRSLINKSSKKDKASIVGDTIDYILELEKQVKFLQRSTMSNQQNKFNAESMTESVKDRSSDTFTRSKVADLLPVINNYTSSEEKSESVERIKQANQPAASNSISDDTINLDHVKANQNFLSGVKANQSFQCEDQFSSAPSKSSSPSTGEPGRHENCRDFSMERGNVQVEVQHLGKQAVVKLVCARSKGLVLRILAALDDCKVEILQSNVTTIDHQVVHFLTIEMNPGVSASLQQMESALQVAASSTWHSEHKLCSNQHKLESKSAYHKVLHSIR